MKEIQPGDTLLGRWVVHEKLPGGGMSTVYRCKHKHVEKVVAIKVMAPPNRGDLAHRSRLERFIREARTASTFDHPNVATIHDFEIEDDIAYLVMELVEGRDLGQVLDVQPLSVVDALYLGIELAKVLALAHGRDIVHRDVKPANIMCSSKAPPEGKALVRILDFGIAKLHPIKGAAQADEFTEARPLSKLTAENAIVGTVPYVAPEGFITGGELDGRADQWALGVVLYEALFEYPFLRNVKDPDPTHLAIAITGEEVAPLIELVPDIPPRLSTTVERMMKKSKSERFSTMDDVYDELWALLSDLKQAADRGGRSLVTIFRKDGLRLPSPDPSRRPRRLRSGESKPDRPSSPAVSPSASTEKQGARDTDEIADASPSEPALTEPPKSPAATPAAALVMPASIDDWIPDTVLRMRTLGAGPSSDEARAALARGLEAHEPAIREAAARALAEIGDQRDDGALGAAFKKEKDRLVKAAIAGSFERLVERASPDAAVAEAPERVAGELARVQAEIEAGAQALPLLILSLETRAACSRAIRALFVIGQPWARRGLFAAALVFADRVARVEARELAREIDLDGVADGLPGGLMPDSGGARTKVLFQLGFMRELVRGQLDDLASDTLGRVVVVGSAPAVRFRAAAALGATGGRGTVASLRLAAERESNDIVKAEVARALDRVEKRAVLAEAEPSPSLPAPLAARAATLRPAGPAGTHRMATTAPAPRDIIREQESPWAAPSDTLVLPPEPTPAPSFWQRRRLAVALGLLAAAVLFALVLVVARAMNATADSSKATTGERR